jgi:hypothetical protein
MADGKALSQPRGQAAAGGNVSRPRTREVTEYPLLDLTLMIEAKVFHIGQKREFDRTTLAPSTTDCRLAENPAVHQEGLVPN